MFGFRKQQRSRMPTMIRRFFVIGMLGIFCLFIGINKLKGLANSSVGDQAIFAQKASWGVSEQMSKLAGAAGRLYEVIQSGGAILDHQQDINIIAEVINNSSSLEKLIPEQFKGLYILAKKRIIYKKDIEDLLGPDRARTYLVALMNDAEIRPNGGFFGSYALVQLYRGRLVQYKVFDSYYAYYQNTGAKVMLDKSYAKLLGQESINFISPNVYGFTPQDGGNIKILYEQLFPGQNLDGVVMVSSHLLEQLLPDLKTKLVDRQFVNACVDLIRGSNQPNKKQQYLSDIGSYLEKNKTELTTQIIQNIPYLLGSHQIQIYLPKSSTIFQEFLAKEGLNLNHDTDSLYIRHSNKSYNKIDRFVSKKFVLQDNDGKVVSESSDGIMDIDPDNLKNTQYDLYLFYTLNVPQQYIDQIYGLTKQYDIELTSRETHILGLSYNRQNQVIVNLPSRLIFQSMDGAYFCNPQTATVTKGKSKTKDCYTLIDGKYNQTLGFQVLGFGNDVLKVVRIKLKKV